MGFSVAGLTVGFGDGISVTGELVDAMGDGDGGSVSWNEHQLYVVNVLNRRGSWKQERQAGERARF